MIEELSGRSFDQFFDQWVYHAHHPELDVNYGWDAKTKLAKVSISQNQKLSADVLLFNFPLTVRFKSKTAITDHPIIVRNKTEDFYFSLPEAPRIVRLDPDYTLLAKIKFNVPDAMLHAQLADTNDLAGRLFAIEQLAGKKDLTTAAKLKETLQGDPFYGVRIEAARALRGDPLRRSVFRLADSGTGLRAIRLQVIGSGGVLSRRRVAAARSLEPGAEPEILEAAIRAPACEAGDKQTLLRYLNPIPIAMNSPKRRSPRFGRRPIRVCRTIVGHAQAPAIRLTFGLGRALDTLASGLPRAVEGRNPRLHRAVTGASGGATGGHLGVGDSEDAKAIPSLETFAGRQESPERNAAEGHLFLRRSETRRRFAGPAQRGSGAAKAESRLRKRSMT